MKKQEIASLSDNTTSENNWNNTLSDSTFDRLIVGNIARHSAFQLLGPIGKDLWDDTCVRIENNAASGYATQIAYPIDFASFRYLLDHQERMAVLKTR